MADFPSNTTYCCHILGAVQGGGKDGAGGGEFSRCMEGLGAGVV